jgi:hypothetical protein
MLLNEPLSNLVDDSMEAPVRFTMLIRSDVGRLVDSHSECKAAGLPADPETYVSTVAIRC